MKRVRKRKGRNKHFRSDSDALRAIYANKRWPPRTQRTREELQEAGYYGTKEAARYYMNADKIRAYRREYYKLHAEKERREASIRYYRSVLLNPVKHEMVRREKYLRRLVKQAAGIPTSEKL